MVYEAFLETIKQSVGERLGPDFTLILQSITKNNGLVLDGLCIEKAGEKAAPTIYLNQFYEPYENGIPINEIVEDILLLYQTNRLPDHIKIEKLSSPEYIKTKIIYRLINEPANQDQLSDIPHISYPSLDLCLIFCLSLHRSQDDLLTALIHNSHLKTWNLTTEELFQAAKINTPYLFPARIRSLSEVIKDIARNSAKEEIEEEDLIDFFDTTPLSPPMYVLTNPAGINGAACMFYDDILKDFATCTDSDLIILPSSIHEVLIIPNSKNISIKELSETVFSINQEEVPEEDRLSNHIYFYSRSSDELTIAFTSSFPIGTKNP
ncbi:DUF5688 family protein [Lacrimispora sp. JR3]|uniref:DUF5688 family protein n=1 Tax=Lacrimispora sinapis TaxID=3111456 RepID=UPI0037483A7E